VAVVTESARTVRRDPTTHLEAARRPYRFTLPRRRGSGFGGFVTRSKDLPGKVSDQGERLFLSEALKCYHAKAFRATIVMAWNLAYDHLLHWILREPARLAAFNSKIAGRVGPKRAWFSVAKREDFEDLKEAEVLDICGTAGLFALDNTKRVLGIQLIKRSLAAHLSLLEIGQPQADDAVYDLVNNVVLALV
jgi:hypothetical protein